MEPTLHCSKAPHCLSVTSDRILVDRFAYAFASVHRSDIIVFRLRPKIHVCGGSRTYVKRVIGIPGDIVGQRGWAVMVNGHRIAEPYLSRDSITQPFPPTAVAPNHYFVLGDNRSISCDSRAFGTITAREVVGKVVAVYGPLGRFRILADAPRPSTTARARSARAVQNPEEARRAPLPEVVERCPARTGQRHRAPTLIAAKR